MRHNKSRRHRYRSNDRGFRRNNNHSMNGLKTISNGQSRSNFFKGNQNASKLLEKYTNLAKEALSSGDRVLSENYYQHADHFSRIVSEKNLEKNFKKETKEPSSTPENTKVDLDTEPQEKVQTIEE